MSIFYSCKKCSEEFDHIDEVENHIEEKHKIFDTEEIDKNIWIHFYLRGVKK